MSLAWSNGKQFDVGTVTSPSTSASVPVGSFKVGRWRRRHEGGRRRLTIPPALGYGSRGRGVIKGGETLVFVVDLLGVS
jgi:peptidylprolyl isomerase